MKISEGIDFEADDESGSRDEEERDAAPSKNVTRRNALIALAASGLAVATAVCAGSALLRNLAEKPAGRDIKDSVEMSASGVAEDAATLLTQRIVPGDEVAQSLLVALCPERLACLAAPLSAYEVPKASSLRNLPMAEHFDCYAGKENDFERLGETGSDAVSTADLVVYVNIAGLGVCQEAQDAFYSKSGIPYVSFTAKKGGLSSLFEQLAATVGVEVNQEAVRCLQDIDSCHLGTLDVRASSYYSASMFGGERGETLYREETSIGAVRKMAGVIPYNLVLSYGDPYAYSGAGDIVVNSFYSNCGIDFIFLSSEEGYALYLNKAASVAVAGVSIWSGTPVSKLGDVLPALVSKRAWLEDMSPFAQLSLGAAWLANYLYPDLCSCDIDELTTRFYRELFGMALSEAKYAAEAEEALSAKRGMSAKEIHAEQEAYFDASHKQFNEVWEQTLEENTRPITDQQQAQIEQQAYEELEELREEQRRNRERIGLE